MTPAQYQDLLLPVLRRLVAHQSQDDPPERYRPSFVYSVLDQLRWRGIRLGGRRGPWTVGGQWLRRSGRGGLPVIPLVRRDDAVVMMDTWDQARQLAGLLNWCDAPAINHQPV
jgi:hypothetical protein